MNKTHKKGDFSKVRYVSRVKEDFIGLSSGKNYGTRSYLTIFYALTVDATCGDERIILL